MSIKTGINNSLQDPRMIKSLVTSTSYTCRPNRIFDDPTTSPKFELLISRDCIFLIPENLKFAFQMHCEIP